jgi:hypothetical protein
MGAAGFYVCSVLVVLSCAAAVLLREPRQSATAAAAVAVSIGLFLVVGGAILLAFLELVLLLATLGIIVLVARRGGYGPKIQALPPRGWIYAAGLAVLALVVVDGASLSGSNGWHRAGTHASLLSVLGHQAPLTAGLLVVVGVAIALAALVIGRTSADEEEHDRRRRARQEREDRMRRRREDREAARRQRSAARPGGGG